MKKLTGFDPIRFAEKIRPKMIDLKNKKVLLASFKGVSQANDIPEAQKFGDYFRVKVYQKRKEIEQGKHNFRNEPAGIASQRLQKSANEYFKQNTEIRTPTIEECNGAFLCQVVNGCNLKCWQCYVDDKNKSANPKYGKFFSAEEILTQFLIESRKAQFLTNPDRKVNIIRLSGGDPFLVPEIIIWIIEAIEKFELQDFIYLWVDSNLMTGNFYWEYLTPEQRKKIKKFKNIGFMGCYKGYDKESFTKTCGAHPKFFKKQFEMHRQLLAEGLDVYSYLYPLVYSRYSTAELKKRISNFISRLQAVGFYSPLRLTTPYTKKYSPTETRLNPERERALKAQYKVIEIWKQEIKKIYGPTVFKQMPHQFPTLPANLLNEILN